jgi:hypothetical protein
MRIWLSGWEWGCCGDPFQVGSEVSLGLAYGIDAWLANALGAELAETVDAREMHHEDEPLPQRMGVVTAIAAVRLRHEGGFPVAGSAQLAPAAAVPWSVPDERPPSGFLVDLDLRG